MRIIYNSIPDMGKP